MGKKQFPKKDGIASGLRRSSKDQTNVPLQVSGRDLPIIIEELCETPGVTSEDLHGSLPTMGGIYKKDSQPEPPYLPEPSDPQEPGTKGKTEDTVVSNPPNRGVDRKWAYMNAYGVCISLAVVFTAFLGLQNLQSSINSTGGLGLASLAVIYIFFTFSGFFTPGFLKFFGTKNSLFAGFICHLLYTISNFYPSWYTLIPASVILGLSSAPIWAAASSHLAQVAVTAAPILKVHEDHLLSLFTGIFFIFFQAAQIPGNLASSLILYPYSSVNTTSQEDGNLSDSSSCEDSSTGEDFDRKFLYILGSVYALFILIGICILFFMVSQLPIDKQFKGKFEFYLKAPIIELFKVLKDCKMLLIAVISVYNGLELSFAFGTFTKEFIASCFGTYLVGFTLLVLGIASAVMSLTSGKIVKWIPIVFIFTIAVIINISLLIFLLLWTVKPSYLVIFLFAIGWGVADGIWNTMTSSLTGILFIGQSDVAYSAQRIWLAVGFTIGFALAEFLSVKSRLLFMLGAVSIAMFSNIVIAILTRKSREDVFKDSEGDKPVTGEACRIESTNIRALVDDVPSSV